MQALPRILFIDDDATGRESAAYSLRKADYHVDLAEDGHRGSASWLACPDWHLPTPSKLLLSQYLQVELDKGQQIPNLRDEAQACTDDSAIGTTLVQAGQLWEAPLVLETWHGR